MNIVIATGIFTPEIGGPATYVPNIAQEFVSLDNTVSVVTYSAVVEYSGDAQLNFSVHRIIRKNKISNYIRFFFMLFFISKKADVIYAFDHMSAGIPAAMVSFLRHKKLYIRVGGDFLWERFLRISKNVVSLREYYRLNLHKKDPIRFWCAKMVFKIASRIIFTTKFQSDVFSRYYFIPKEKISYIYNPIPKIPGGLRYNKKNNHIVFAGRIVAKNNVSALIQAFSVANTGSAQLVIIGDGEEKAGLVRYVVKNRITNVVFRDRVARNELWNIFSSCHAVVFPSSTDISPNTLLDCVVLGTPFISSTEIGYDWVHGRVRMFNPLSKKEISEALEYICSDSGYAKTVGVVQSVLYDYSFSDAAKDTLKIFQCV